MNSICNYFLILFLFAVIICQFGVKAPRGSGNRNRGQQVTNHHVTDVNQLLRTLYELVPQNPGPAQKIEETINYIRSLNAQVGNLSDAIANVKLYRKYFADIFKIFSIFLKFKTIHSWNI
uniref:Uncharacterized protein n=1 Tax=Meloidogyne enterolobii TaxID=390850 RepID=A0A6V7TS34_MELEN|nr:unnamed protein product [Meloidogyne enterolobii]